MNHRFASITADLLIRKGHAKPWQPPDWATEPETAEPAETGAPLRRCAVRLTECEYQRLGIVAVKTDTTRQQVLRRAVETFLKTAEREFGGGCGCLSGRSCGQS